MTHDDLDALERAFQSEVDEASTRFQRMIGRLTDVLDGEPMDDRERADFIRDWRLIDGSVFDSFSDDLLMLSMPEQLALAEALKPSDGYQADVFENDNLKVLISEDGSWIVRDKVRTFASVYRHRWLREALRVGLDLRTSLDDVEAAVLDAAREAVNARA